MEFINLKAQYNIIKENLNKKISTVLEHGNYIMGPEVALLEKKLAEFVGCNHCITCASGTDALLMALMSYGVGPGDAILTTPFTFIATAEVITLLGATPVFVDIDSKTFNIDPRKLDDTIQNIYKGIKMAPGMPDKLKVKGIIPVDLFGLPADYDAINSIAGKWEVFVLEDAAQSFGATYKGKRACNLTHNATTSFFPAKPLGCYGDGGAIFTNDNEMADRLMSIRVHGKGTDKYDNIRIGINGRLDTLQAAILLSKFEIFPEEIRLRQKVASCYSQELRHKVTVPYIPEGCISVWAQYSLISERRDEIMSEMKKQGIPASVYYPKPLHLQTAFSFLGYRKGSMPVSEYSSENIFSLPMHPYITEEEQSSVIKGILQNY